ncbi:MAG TPA: FeoB-associated Cys-rich membrane protein [Gemmata sp.]|jgi:hypothetical protein|nr:FeoB-associated Cys-rich membrane protein [Gemmata sp.]
MTTAIQLAIVGALIAAAMVYIVRSAWKTWFGKSSKGCGAGCGKCAVAPEAKPEGRFPLPQL